MAKYIVVESPVSISGVVFEKDSEVEVETEIAEAFGVEYLKPKKEKKEAKK
jgi:hypothetical protein